MYRKMIAVAALALLAGCATPPPPAAGSAASKVVPMGGDIKGIDIGAMRVARENGFLTVKVQLKNLRSNNTPFYYRFAWLGNDGFPIADEESWKAQTLYGGQLTFLTAIAPIPQATDFRLEIKTP